MPATLGYDFMDVAFNWTDRTAGGGYPTEESDAIVMSYGFGGDNMDGYSSDRGYAKQNAYFYIRIFDESETDGVSVDEVKITSVRSSHSTTDNVCPFDSCPIATGPLTRTDHQSSPALNIVGSEWGTQWLTPKNLGSFLITVTVKATKGRETRWYTVDPELVVGTKSMDPVGTN